MRYLLFVLISWQSLAVANAQLGEHQVISQYLDSETVLVGWIDISRVDVEQLSKFMGDIESAAPNASDVERMKAIQAALMQLNVRRIYAISDLPSLVPGAPEVVIPCKNPQAVAPFLTAMIGNADYRLEPFGDFVLGGSQSEIERLKNSREELSLPLTAALNASTGPHGVVLVVPATLTASAVSAFQSMLEEDETAKISQTAEGLASIQWLSLSGQLPPSQAQLRVETDSPAAAAKLMDVAAGYAKRLADRAAELDWRLDQKALLLTSHSSQEAAAKLLAIRDLFSHGRSPQVANSMKQIALALHNYYEVHGHFPPQSLVDANGNRLLSWRVLILPFLEQQALYNQFYLDEPWDSPHNLQLAEIIPSVYVSNGRATAGAQKTRIVAPLTPDSAFGRPGKPVTFRDITDGTSNTIWFVEGSPQRAVVWTQPEDLLIDLSAPVASILSAEATGFWAARIDGSVQFVERELATQKFVEAMLTINGGEVVEK